MAMMLAAVWFYLRNDDSGQRLMVVIMSFLVLLRSPRRAAAFPAAYRQQLQAMPMRRTPCPSCRTGRAGTPGSTALPSTMFRSLDQRPILRMYPSPSGQNHHRHRTYSGSGKTTLCNLIARFWDVESGTVLVGGQNVRTILWRT
ncbi:MAG: hypothetical protein ACLTYN_16810 [Dysosmobacter welbionis]